MAETGMLAVQVVWVDAQAQVQERSVALPAGAQIHDALRACGLEPGTHAACGVWGRTLAPDHGLQDGDRVELYQPLKVDPKVARRERFAQQGARGVGLFASRRPNSKSGY
ncbi:RnfH family protein [Comamonas sp. CAH-2]|uniref:RnfH family protein n=1 Tax=Comamonas sp. CAH-2 TaxID=2605745 RepID=UPI0012ADA5AE|nr:RnfH family protein [Comamonas sp. CAH-2]MRT19311.1 RnfH family protein [Comamonas sp. CAH-2]